MIRSIVQYGNPVLRQKCPPVAAVTDELRTLAEDMLETMRAANGVGLAAPQVGVATRLAVVDVSHDPECLTLLRVGGEDVALDALMPLVFINPELEPGGEKVADQEGCLSIRELRAMVTRPEMVKARLTLLDGRRIEVECDGLLARALQHEVDHLNGILFIDRLSPATKLSLKRRLRRLAAEEEASRAGGAEP
jgi:peptide deformylase